MFFIILIKKPYFLKKPHSIYMDKAEKANIYTKT